MGIFYSATTNGFYDSALNKTMPADAVKITHEQRAELLAGHSARKLIKPGAGGRPTLQSPPEPTVEQKRHAVLAQRSRAYRLESDPLKLEAEYDALIAGTEPDYSAWLAKVAEIKERYPLPNH
ncbi:hypothetical protein GCM10027398_17720 [Azotobacter salinestris]